MKTVPQKAQKIKRILELENLSFIADKPIIDSITWNVDEGQRWVLLGANGAGKTSLISTLCAYNTPSSGRMCVDGKEYSNFNWQKVRERIALVGSQLRQNIDRSENALEVVVSGKFAQINFWGKITKPLIMEAYKKMKALGVGHLVDSKWGTLSQGERQKILIARSLMTKPSVVFLDEPCIGLDPVARKKFIAFMKKLADNKKIPAIVLATHYVDEIPDSFTHALIIKKGRIIACGKISDVMNSQNLSKAYGAKCELSKVRGSYSLKVL